MVCAVKKSFTLFTCPRQKKLLVVGIVTSIPSSEVLRETQLRYCQC